MLVQLWRADRLSSRLPPDALLMSGTCWYPHRLRVCNLGGPGQAHKWSHALWPHAHSFHCTLCAWMPCCSACDLWPNCTAAYSDSLVLNTPCSSVPLEERTAGWLGHRFMVSACRWTGLGCPARTDRDSLTRAAVWLATIGSEQDVQVRPPSVGWAGVEVSRLF